MTRSSCRCSASNEAGQSGESRRARLAVVDDSLLKLADDDSPAMPTHFYLTSEVEKPEDLEKADFYLSDDAKADEALDLLLGTQGWRRFVEQALGRPAKKGQGVGAAGEARAAGRAAVGAGRAALPPTVLDNLDDVRPQYEKARAASRGRLSRGSVAQLSRAAIYGGFLLGATVDRGERRAASARIAEWSWRCCGRRFGPALAAAGMCVVVGLLWIAGGRRSGGIGFGGDAGVQAHSADR